MSRRLTIAHKLMLIVLATSGIALVLASGALIAYDRGVLRQALVRDLTIIADVIGTSSGAALLFHDELVAHEVLAALRAEPHIRAACLYDAAGQPFVWYGRRQPTTDVVPPPPQPDGVTFDSERLRLFHTVRLGQRTRGTLYIESDLQEFDDRLRRFPAMAGLILVGAWVVAVLFSSWMQRLMCRPIFSLMTALRRIVSEQERTRKLRRKVAERERIKRTISDNVRPCPVLSTSIGGSCPDKRRCAVCQYPILLNSIADPIFVVDQATHRILHCNEAALKVYGYAREELQAMTPFDLHPPEEGERVAQCIDRKSEGREIYTHLCKTGVRIRVSLHSEEIEYQGRPAWLTVVRDVTTQAQVAEQLQIAKDAAEAASRAKSDFLATLSHEIRTPLNGIIGMLELLEDTELTDEQRQLAQIALDSAAGLLVIINDVFDIAKIEAGKLTIEAAPFDLFQAVGDVVKLFAPQARQKGLDLWLRVSPDVPRWVVGDAARIRQVIMNLVGNALKFTEDGSVSISVTVDETVRSPSGSGVGASACRDMHAAGRIRVAVTDTGVGIAAEKLEHIFEKFTQADDSTARRYGGTGLGLAICRQLVELMGGQIGVTSVKGEGSTFWFTLPLPVADVSSAAIVEGGKTRSDAPATSPHGQPRLRVLLVEDNLINQEVAARMLRTLGHQVEVATTGREAVERVEQEDYDLVLMDCQMPEMDGYEATRLIRQRETERGRSRRLPIVALTALALRGDSERCRAAGMDGCLVKPVRLDHLRRTLDDILEPQRADRPSEPLSPSSHEAVLDGTRTLERVGGDRSLLREIIDLFVADTPQVIEDIERALAEKNCRAVERAAHRLRGASSNFGARRATEAALGVECAAREGDLAAAAAQVTDLKEAVAQLVQALQDLKEETLR